MRIIAASLAVAGLAVASPALAQSLVGTWEAKVVTDMGEFTETLTVAEAGGAYSAVAEPTGAAAAFLPGPLEAVDVVLDGDSFSFRRSLETPGGALDITYSGVVDGDTFTGVAASAMGPTPYTGVRN